MIRPSHWCVLLVLILSVAPSSTEAADRSSSAAEMYSHGVHSYFSGNLNRADVYLYRAAELSPNDPRPYYFRALALLRLGRTGEADDLLRTGAAIEANSNASAYGIGEALQRVQGANRLKLEQFRRAAKLDQANRAIENARRRYDQHLRIQTSAGRRPVRLSLDALSNPVEPSQLATLLIPEEALPTVPVAPAVAPEEVVAADQGDPFADDPVSQAAATDIPDAAGEGAPEATAGSVKAGSLPGIFGRILGRQLPTVDVDRIRGMVPSIGGGEMPPDMPQDLGGAAPSTEVDPFGSPEMPAEFGESPNEIPAVPPADEEGSPF
ncbi:MAG: hypothetical protein WD851_19975 [Pirellulales bacterium]